MMDVSNFFVLDELPLMLYKKIVQSVFRFFWEVAGICIPPS
jgi:hypothetical protein